MAELGAIHEDVQFDWLKAGDLASELRLTATELEFQVGERDRIRATARGVWQGRYGDEFDHRVATCAGDAGRFVPSLRDAATNVDSLAELARQEQDRRVAAREWEASQDDGGGGGFGLHTFTDPIAGGADAVDDFFTGEDDLPPPPPPFDPPTFVTEDPAAVARDAGALGPPPTYGTGGVSSAVPDDLDAWATASRGLDSALVTRQGTLDTAHADFTATLGWGSFNASSLLSAVGTWLTWNETDAQWVATIAQAFRDNGGGVLPDAVIQTELNAASLAATRTSVTYDEAVAWGLPPTSGYADDPVNTASGNFVEPETDLAAAGLCRLLLFARTDNSRSDHVGPFGPGWGSWASVRLRAEADGAHWVGPDGQETLIPRGPGAHDGEVAYRRVAGVPGLVSRADDGSDGDGDNHDDNHDGDGDGDGDSAGLVLDGLAGDSRLAFDAAGRPVRADEGPGTEVRFAYDGDRLVELRHQGGRTVTLEWDGDRVVELRASDGRAVAYHYDHDRRLVGTDGGPRGSRRYDLDPAGRIVAVTDADDVVEVRTTYDDEGRVVAQVSPFGRRTRYRYLPGRVTVVDDDAGGPVNSYVHDDAGRLVGAVDGHGHELRKTYDRWGNPTQVTERDGSTALQEWDDRSRLLRVLRADGSSFVFTYDDRGRILSVTASTGATTRYRYAGAERNPVEVTDPSGAVTQLAVSDGLVRRVVDPDGVEVQFDYDDNGDLTAVTDAAGNRASIWRDLAGRVTSTMSPMGRRTSISYDGHGRPVSRRDPGGRVWIYEWSAGGRLLTVVDPTGARRSLRYGTNGEAEQIADELGQVTSRRFDALGNLVGVVLPDGAKWELGYDQLSRLTSIGDPAGATWLREYDVTGHLVGSVDPVGTHRSVAIDPAGRIAAVDDGLTSVEFGYDELGRAVEHRRPDGSAGRATYDACGRVTSVTDPAGGVTRYGYTAAGRLAEVVSPLGHATRYEYDRRGQRVGMVDPLGQHWSTSHDGDGQVTQVVGPTGETTRFRYDDGGRLAARVSSTGGTTRYEYDRLRRVVAVTSPGGGVRRFGWDARGQLASAVDANGGVTRYQRDERGFLRTLVDPLGGTVTYDYDPSGRLVARTDQLDRTTRWEYDAAGRVVRRVLPTGEVVRRWYDASGRALAVGVGDDQLVRFSRDRLGRAIVVEEPGFRHELEWDGLGRLVAKRRNGLGLTWRYDADGRRRAVGFPDGSATTYDHDPAGRLESASHPALGDVTLAHDASGRLLERRSRLAVERWTYRDGLLVEHSASGHFTSLRRDEAGRVVAAVTDGVETAFGYDPAGQLISAGSFTFRYDEAGRLVAETGPPGDVSYRYDAAHQLVAREVGPAVTSFAYDAAGRRTAAGPSTTYGWDWLGRLAHVDDTHLAADALDDLAEIDGMPLLWDPVGPVPQLRWLDGAAWVGDQSAWAVVPRDGAAAGLAHDWQGSVGAVPDPWGVPPPDRAAELGLGYRGELQVDGLLWLRHRCYDSATRSFLSTDPRPGVPGDPFAANPYHYAGNNPVGAVDPFGLSPMSEADLAAYREAAASNGLFDHVDAAWDATTSWVGDNWEYIAAGAMIVGGVVVMATGVGGPIGAAMIGGALLGGGISAGSQRALTGEVNWRQVGVDAAIGALAGGAGAWSGGATAAWGTTARVSTQIAVNTGTDVTGGMVNRALNNQDPFDPQAIALDTLTGTATGGLGASADGIRVPRAGVVPKTVTIGPTGGPRILGETDAFGNITIQPGLAPDVFEETLRHERVHSVLSPTRGTLLANTRARFQSGLYEHSHLYTYAEEALAEGYATRSLREGLQFPLREGYVTPGRLALEGAGVAGTTAAAGYVGYEVGSGE